MSGGFNDHGVPIHVAEQRQGRKETSRRGKRPGQPRVISVHETVLIHPNFRPLTVVTLPGADLRLPPPRWAPTEPLGQVIQWALSRDQSAAQPQEERPTVQSQTSPESRDISLITERECASLFSHLPPDSLQELGLPVPRFDTHSHLALGAFNTILDQFNLDDGDHANALHKKIMDAYVRRLRSWPSTSPAGLEVAVRLSAPVSTALAATAIDLLDYEVAVSASKPAFTVALRSLLQAAVAVAFLVDLTLGIGAVIHHEPLTLAIEVAEAQIVAALGAAGSTIILVGGHRVAEWIQNSD